MKYLLALLLMLGLLISACGKLDEDHDGTPPSAEDFSTTAARGVLKYADHAQRRRNQKKYFLVAGGHQIANFAEEVVEQKAQLEALGAKPEEIACFYTIPPDRLFFKDEEHYRALAPQLSQCYPAYPRYVWEQLQDGGPHSDDIYLYVTSHGSDALGLEMTRMTDPEARENAADWIHYFPEVDQFEIALDAQADGEPGDYRQRERKLKKNLDSAVNMFFTPRYLKQALESATTPEAHKYIVLQACHSGGFIDVPDPRYSKDTLKDLPNTVILAAARSDRASFGCDPGSFRTKFGGSFIDHWKAKKQLPSAVDWKSLYTEVSQDISGWEKALEFKPSEPMYFSNLPDARLSSR